MDRRCRTGATTATITLDNLALLNSTKIFGMQSVRVVHHFSVINVDATLLIDRQVLKYLFKLCSIGILIWSMSLAPALAAFCRQVEGHRICIVDIKRSAKNYWQYQAVVSNDGVESPSASYDCRERLIIDLEGKVSSFRSRKDAKFVCSLYRSRG